MKPDPKPSRVREVERAPAPPPPPVRHLTPQLIWASIPEDMSVRACDCEVAPSFERIKQRLEHCQKGMLGLAAFWEAAKASARLLIFDLHFDQEAAETMCGELTQSTALTEVRVISGEPDAIRPFNEMRSALISINRLNMDALYDIKIVPRKKNDGSKEEFPFVHDRFAVTGHELWHFGGTVGCHEPTMTAASRGWDAEGRSFVKFFDQVWKLDKTGKPRR